MVEAHPSANSGITTGHGTPAGWRSIVVGAVAVLAIAGCSGASQDSAVTTPSPEPPAYRVSLDAERVFLNDIIRFSLLDVVSGEVADTPYWSVTSPHNVPGDRGVMRSDGVYTAPRIAPDPQIVKISARFQKIDYPAEFFVLDPRFPDPDATSSPGGSHTIFNIRNIETTRPIENGLPVGESVGFTVTDGTGRPLVIDHYEIRQDNRVVDHAGTITPDGIYTAPLNVPDPPKISIAILYLREGGTPGHLSMIGIGVTIVPAE